MKSLKILHVASHNAIKAGGSNSDDAAGPWFKTERAMMFIVCLTLRLKILSPGLAHLIPSERASIRVFSFPMQRIYKYNGMLKFRRFLHANAFNVVHCHRLQST